jgi:hypothetical protein
LLKSIQAKILFYDSFGFLPYLYRVGCKSGAFGVFPAVNYAAGELFGPPYYLVKIEKVRKPYEYTVFGHRRKNSPPKRKAVFVSKFTL